MREKINASVMVGLVCVVALIAFVFYAIHESEKHEALVNTTPRQTGIVKRAVKLQAHNGTQVNVMFLLEDGRQLCQRHNVEDLNNPEWIFAKEGDSLVYAVDDDTSIILDVLWKK